jgi:hypothetical protein
MKSFRLIRSNRLQIIFPVAFLMNVLGLVVFVLHCDSPHSWVCSFEYFGLPGLLLGFIAPFPDELGARYGGTIIASILLLSFLTWSWVVERAIDSLVTWHRRGREAAV